MEQANPYATPSSQVSDVYADEGFGDVKIFTSNGRMGRVRYFFYGMLIGLAGMVLLGIAAILLSVSPVLGGILMAVIYIAMIVVSILLTIQRCHDFNMTGWLSLLLLVPLAPLVFYFIPGTKATNQFGQQPPPNSKGVVAGAILLPLAMIVIMGILAAIAVPAFDDYQQKARDAAVQMESTN